MARFTWRVLITAGSIAILVLLLKWKNREYFDREEKTREKWSPGFRRGSEFWDKLTARMEKNVEEGQPEPVQEIVKMLPKPEEAVKKAAGPAKRGKMPVFERLQILLQSLKCENLGRAKKPGHLFIVGRPGSGLEKIANLLHRRFNFFVYDADNFVADKAALFRGAEKLSRCEIDGEKHEEIIAENSLIGSACTLADECHSDGGELLAKMCRVFDARAMISTNVDMAVGREVLSGEMEVFYVVRDPRAMMCDLKVDIKEGMGDFAASTCRQLARDLEFIDHKMPKFRFHIVRAENFGRNATIGEFSAFSSTKCQDGPVLDIEPADSWMHKLTMEDIIAIEEKCTDVLVRLEYPLYGSTLKE